MARLIGPDEGSRTIYLRNGLVKAAGRSVTLYADSGKTQLANVLTLAGAAIPGSVVQIDAASKIPLVQFPDGVDTIYAALDASSTPVPLYARTDDRLDALEANVLGNRLAVGEIAPDRHLITTNGVIIGSSIISLTYFTSARTENINTLTLFSGNIAAAATPTLIRYCVYSVANNGNLSLVAATPNDTTLLAATNTAYPKALSSTWNKVANVRYAVGLLVVSDFAVPTLHGSSHAATAVFNTLSRTAPAIIGRLSAQTDLPASITAGSMIGGQQAPAVQMS